MSEQLIEEIKRLKIPDAHTSYTEGWNNSLAEVLEILKSESRPVQQPAPTFAATTQNCDCKASSGICGQITRGTGRLDNNGYWEFECQHGNAFRAYDPKQFEAPVQQPATEPDEEVSERQKVYEDGCREIAKDLEAYLDRLPVPHSFIAQAHLTDLFACIRTAYGNGRADAARHVPVGTEVDGKFIEAVEELCTYSHGGWDMEDPKVICKAVLKVAASPLAHSPEAKEPE